MKAKRLFALLLALVMLLTLLPTAGWATEETEDGSDPAITVTRELPEEPETPETAELQPLLSEEEDIPIPGAERNVVVIDDDFVADLSGLQEDEDVCGEFEIVSEREPDGEPVPSARRRLVRSTYTFSGSGTKADPWLISSEEDLAGLAAMVNAGNSFSDQYFKLTDDITITAENWTPIGCAWDITFAGTFRGFEHTISGLTITSEGDYVGLFGCTNKGAVSGISQTGGIIGIAYCLVTDCANLENGTVNGSGERIGGVIGCLDDVGRAEHIRNEGTATGGQYVGGLIGMALCEVSGLTNDGSVNGGEYTGGIAGFCNVVSNCVNNGAVKSTTNDKVGGIVGASNSPA